MRSLHFLPIASLCLFSNASFAQSQGEVYKPDTSVKVYAHNKELSIAFSGGFNIPQFAIADLNNDGKKDLVVFEKTSFQVKTFINYGTAGSPDYRYRPQYEKNFPRVNDYLKMEDYNCDNVPDLFHRGGSGISVWAGKYNSNNELTFSYYKDVKYTSLSAGGEGFENGTFPPPGGAPAGPWSSDTGWTRQTSGSSPTAMPHSGLGMARFNSANLTSGTKGTLASKRIRVSYNVNPSYVVSFWIYRSNDASSTGDSIAFYISKNNALTNLVFIDRIARSRSINLPDTKPADGWYKYSYLIPKTAVSDSAHFVFKGTSQGGANIYIDDLSWVTSNIYGDINAYIEPNDIPGMADVDNDGDLDFVAYQIQGAYLGYYKNYQEEEAWPCDSIRVNFKDACWGKVFQGFDRKQDLGIACLQPDPLPAKTTKTTHTGNTLCLADLDADGDYDYLNGNVSFSDIQYFQNGKHDYSYPIDTMIAEDTLWQTNGHQLQQTTWPGAFWLDYDQDGKKDLLFSPHADGSSENVKCISWYRNTGTIANPVYTYQSDSLLTNLTMDMGANAYPLLYDYDKDGKLDLFLGAEGIFAGGVTLHAKIAYYKNTSISGSPSFTLVDSDFLSIGSQNIQGAAPAVGDLDNDGKDDLVIGHKNGTISLYLNTASSTSAQPVWQLSQTILKDENGTNIDSSKYAAPFIYDINKDGKKDLLIGGEFGYVTYYKNTANAGQVKLSYQTNKLGGAKVDPFNLFSGFSTPYIGRMDNLNEEYLVLGTNSGRLYRYAGFSNGNTTTPYLLLDTAYNGFSQAQYNQYDGYRSAATFGDIDGDGKYEMILGNTLGGVKIYKQKLMVTTPIPITNVAIINSENSCTIYPNPAKNEVYINWSSTFGNQQDVLIDIYDITGQHIAQQKVDFNEHATTIDVKSLARGSYFCTITSGGIKIVKKLILID